MARVWAAGERTASEAVAERVMFRKSKEMGRVPRAVIFGCGNSISSAGTRFSVALPTELPQLARVDVAMRPQHDRSYRPDSYSKHNTRPADDALACLSRSHSTAAARTVASFQDDFRTGINRTPCHIRRDKLLLIPASSSAELELLEKTWTWEGRWENLDLAGWVRTCTAAGSKWAESADILGARATLLGVRDIPCTCAGRSFAFTRPPSGTLRLLAATQPSDAREVVKRRLAGEEVPLEVQGVRERVLRIGRVETVVKDKQREANVGPDLCAVWLIAQLKVNLRPLWSPAVGTAIWRRDLESMEDVDEETGDAEKDPWEEERDRLDAQTYESQLLFALGECSALVQKHNRDIVPFFLDLAMPGPDSSSGLPRHKLAAWPTLFSKLSNPKVLHSTDALRDLYIANLSHPDRALQSIALSCILTYKSPRLTAYESHIRAFLDDTRWRDELMRLDLSQVELQDRAEVVPVITRLLFGLMLERKGRSRGADRRAAVLGQQPFSVCDVPAEVSEKQQIGFIGLLGDVVRNLGPRLVAYWPALLGTMDWVARAQVRINSADRAEEEAAEDDENSATSSGSKILRSIRQLGLKRLADFMQAVFPAFISPCLASLDKENTQAPSSLLELFYVWMLDTWSYQRSMTATNVKPAVVSKIFDIVGKLLAFSTVDSNVSDKVVKLHVSLLLNNLAILVERTKGTASVSTQLGQRQISILSEIAQYSTDASQASTLLTLFAPLLRRPPKVVPEKVQGSEIYVKTSSFYPQLFQSLRFCPARISLVDSLRRLSLLDPSLERLAQILESLNAYSSRRVDEPDFDRRLSAFTTLNETLNKYLSQAEWLPIIYSILHFIQDPAELAIRNNAAFAVRHFIDLVAARISPEFETMFTKDLFPGLKNGLRSKNELVRPEIFGVFAYAVTKCNTISLLQEMRVLLAGGDEEANFNNIHHIQIHRRSRALRSNTLAEIFVPLVGNYITATSAVDHHLVNDAILTTGRMAKRLTWGAYYALVQKYVRLSGAKNASERVYVRTVVSLLDNFHFRFPMEEAIPVVEDADEDGEEENEGDEGVPTPQLPIPAPLHKFRSYCARHTTRIPNAIGIVKVAKYLPATTREPQIARLLTVLIQVLRSKSQETLSRIATRIYVGLVHNFPYTEQVCGEGIYKQWNDHFDEPQCSCLRTHPPHVGETIPQIDQLSEYEQEPTTVVSSEDEGAGQIEEKLQNKGFPPPARFQFKPQDMPAASPVHTHQSGGASKRQVTRLFSPDHTPTTKVFAQIQWAPSETNQPTIDTTRILTDSGGTTSMFPPSVMKEASPTLLSFSLVTQIKDVGNVVGRARSTSRPGEPRRSSQKTRKAVPANNSDFSYNRCARLAITLPHALTVPALAPQRLSVYASSASMDAVRQSTWRGVEVLRQVQAAELSRQSNTRALLESVIRSQQLGPASVAPLQGLGTSFPTDTPGLPPNSSHKSLVAHRDELDDELHPDAVHPTLQNLYNTQNTLDLAHDTAYLRTLMRDAVSQSSDAEMIRVLQVGREDMPEALKTLQRALERVGVVNNMPSPSAPVGEAPAVPASATSTLAPGYEVDRDIRIGMGFSPTFTAGPVWLVPFSKLGAGLRGSRSADSNSMRRAKKASARPGTPHVRARRVPLSIMRTPVMTLDQPATALRLLRAVPCPFSDGRN
ncbi:hypothetical protein B0H11DRAFT_2433535 [Mycena galericulata]|nr:hypothetical protein B0H11DRAFT_2433535 [Mycena galericulata]